MLFRIFYWTIYAFDIIIFVLILFLESFQSPYLGQLNQLNKEIIFGDFVYFSTFYQKMPYFTVISFDIHFSDCHVDFFLCIFRTFIQQNLNIKRTNIPVCFNEYSSKFIQKNKKKNIKNSESFFAYLFIMTKQLLYNS